MMMEKVSTISQNTANSQELGKLINMLSNDFNIIENRLKFIVQIFSFPIQFLVIILILLYRLGEMVLIIFLTLTLSFTLQFLLGKLEAKFQVEININKD